MTPKFAPGDLVLMEWPDECDHPSTIISCAVNGSLISYDVETKTPGVFLVTKDYPEEKLERWLYDDESRG